MIDLVLGVGMVAFGLFTIIARIKKWDGVFAKKDAMIKAFGKRAGEMVHICAYSILPILVGLIFIISSFP